MTGYSATFDKLPPSIQQLIKAAVQNVDPIKIILFGSRARGDHRENSDFDLAFDFEQSHNSAWTDFVTSIEDKPLTLFKVDLVKWSELDSEYIKNIKRDGVTLYERR